MASSPATPSPAGPPKCREYSTNWKRSALDLTDGFILLEDEGVEKFAKSCCHLLEATQGQLDAATR